MTLVNFKIGNIATEDNECIVNSTNAQLAWEETTINGDIQNAGGEGLMNALQEYHRRSGDLKVSDTLITIGFNCRAGYIIHTYAPVWNGKQDDIIALKNCYKNIYHIADSYNISRISIPSIGTGVFRFPKQIAADIAQREAHRHPRIKTTFVLFDKNTEQIYLQINKEIENDKNRN